MESMVQRDHRVVIGVAHDDMTSVLRQPERKFRQSSLVVPRKQQSVVLGETVDAPGCDVWRVEVHQVARTRSSLNIAKVACPEDYGPEQPCNVPYSLLIANGRVLLGTEWSVELSLSVDPVEAIPAGPVEINESSRLFSGCSWLTISDGIVERLVMWITAQHPDNVLRILPN